MRVFKHSGAFDGDWPCLGRRQAGSDLKGCRGEVLLRRDVGYEPVRPPRQHGQKLALASWQESSAWASYLRKWLCDHREARNPVSVEANPHRRQTSSG